MIILPSNIALQSVVWTTGLYLRIILTRGIDDAIFIDDKHTLRRYCVNKNTHVMFCYLNTRFQHLLLKPLNDLISSVKVMS